MELPSREEGIKVVAITFGIVLLATFLLVVVSASVAAVF